MIIVRNKAELMPILERQRVNGKIIGFVPTMGALHAGHISLIENSLKQSDFTVCSIFVNPTQFNDKADLERSPRMPEKDAAMLEKAGCHMLYMPEVMDIYPETDTRVFDFGHLDKVLEGAHRDGHFNGVGQVVSRLFDIVKPQKAFFGLKDYQQVAIIKKLCEILNYKIEIIACPILREADGLAMSSRNMLLNEEERKAASLIPQLMQEAQTRLNNAEPIESVKKYVLEKLSHNPIYKPDYFDVCDANTLLPLNSLIIKGPSIILIACFVGKIRLIDNLVMN
ncbi:MAG TPA: pantoate--beta-alanine ligase [Bacteroidia bacterium]|nr:pantoate--beta-alanine ligase [Bacteroidia bacterium]